MSALTYTLLHWRFCELSGLLRSQRADSHTKTKPKKIKYKQTYKVLLSSLSSNVQRFLF